MVASEKTFLLTEHFAQLRLLVGYLGQRKQSGWWDCEFLGPLGFRFLETVFPRTARTAALRSTSEAACTVHDRSLGRVGNYHLFRLPPALADFIDPKLRSVRAEISSLRESKARRDRLEELLDLEQELEDFHAEIKRIIKLPWKPNLNDGVLITASPLWKLFRLPKWQKDLKACWEKLERGDYDWAHLAYTIWPKRVEEVCTTDRSIAIAHGLEHLCQVQAPKPKAKRGKKASTPTFEGMEP